MSAESYLIARIVEMSSELSDAQAFADSGLSWGLGLIVGGVLAILCMYAVCRARRLDFILDTPSLAIVVALCCIGVGGIFLMIYLADMSRIPEMQAELNELIGIYEELYGALPEGLV